MIEGFNFPVESAVGQDAEYFQFCETLFENWRREKIQLRAYLEDKFDLDAIPEPYLYHRKAAVQDTLYFLTTNPGQTLPIQVRGHEFHAACNSYQELDQKLVSYYHKSLGGTTNGANVSTRINKMLALTEMLGLAGNCQVELIPFHSKELPNKQKVFAVAETDTFISNYLGCIQGLLRDKNVVCVIAGDSNAGLNRKSLDGPVVAYYASSMGFQKEQFKMLPLVRKGDKTTSAAYINRQERCYKVFIMSCGHNNLPAQESLELFAKELS